MSVLLLLKQLASLVTQSYVGVGLLGFAKLNNYMALFYLFTSISSKW